MDSSRKEPVIKTVAALLEEFSVGVGRITPGPRGSRLSGEPRVLLEAAMESLSSEEIRDHALVYGNGCYALGRHDEASSRVWQGAGPQPFGR